MEGVHPMMGRREGTYLPMKNLLCPQCGMGYMWVELPIILANIFRSLVGQSPHHIKNTQQFVDYIHKVKLEPGEVITSYNIRTLFTSVPIHPSSAIVQQQITAEPSTIPKKQHVHPPNNQPFRVLSQKHIIPHPQ